MKTVKDVLEAKGNSQIWSISPNASALEAVKLMDDKNVGALLVIDGEKLVGVIAERDIARRLVLKSRSSRDTIVKDIMTSDLYGVPADTEIEKCLMLMTEKRVRHLPVFENDHLVGVISIGNIVKSVILRQDSLIENLQDYILGKYI
ncbi:MAG: CBS domain-containing protein [Syntrophales bacterium]|jgi:CBS domain-containing protein|nr:CBS domain-containing protein [Syntrophales bacterium]NLN61078.1 CBS domain-containing protein [Deltaproteobacteria bacterium]